MRDFGPVYEKKTVVVTGGNGYLASALSAALKKTTARIVVVSRQELAPVDGVESLKRQLHKDINFAETLKHA